MALTERKRENEERKRQANNRKKENKKKREGKKKRGRERKERKRERMREKEQRGVKVCQIDELRPVTGCYTRGDIRRGYPIVRID